MEAKKRHEHWRVFEEGWWLYNSEVLILKSGTIGEEYFTFAAVALHGLLQPGISSIELLVADGMCGEDGTTNRNYSIRREAHCHGLNDVLSKRLATRGCACT